MFTTITAAVAIIALSAGFASAASTVDQMMLVSSSNGDLGSGALEWSGATYNGDRNVLVTVDDEHNAYELDLDASGSVDADEPVRVIDINIGAGDYEGIAWMSGDRYALLSEATGVAYIVDIDPAATAVSAADVAWSFNAGGPDGNTGSEAIAVDAAGNFFVSDEMPASISKYDPAGNLITTVALTGLGDATGVAVAQDDTYIVISHESARAAHYDIDWDTGTATELNSVDLAGFSQLEGVAIIANTDLHLFGELKGGQTYAHYRGQITAPVVDDLDVNCSGSVDIADALQIAMVEVGTSQLVEGCGTGDSNRDGQTTIADALLIAQCQVGITNTACQ